MTTLRHLVEDIYSANESSVVPMLQNILVCFLRSYHLSIGGKDICPLEVEAYYAHDDNYTISKDTVHNDKEKQRNRNKFGCLYSHGAGFDVCLSSSEKVRFGVLIRWARVDGVTLQPGPLVLYDYVKNGKDKNFYSKIEDSHEVILVRNDYPVPEKIFFSSRIGLRNVPDKDETLRAVMVNSLNKDLCGGFVIKKKEELLESYLRLHPECCTEEFIRQEMGYIPSQLKALIH